MQGVLGAEPLGEGVMEDPARAGWVGWEPGLQSGEDIPLPTIKSYIACKQYDVPFHDTRRQR